MKKSFYIFTFLVLSTFSSLAQDVAICGWDGDGGEEISFVLLRDHVAGEVIYFTEDEYVEATGNFNTTEGHLVYTIPGGGLLENEVIRITETTANNFSVGCAGGTAVAVGSGSWSFSNTDEMYAYSASNPASPWSSVTEVHCFAWSSNTNYNLLGQNPTSDYPNAIIIDFNIGGPSGANANFNDASRINTTLAMLQNGSNWTQSTGDITLTCTDFTTQMIALPVELIKFEADEKDENIILNWSTASEINNEYFQIEHSTDGVQFERIDQVAGVGNSEQINHYNSTHQTPTNGINYYRLKQVDYDGLFEYSDIISVAFQNQNNEISVFPNPFTESVTIKIPTSEQSYSANRACIIQVFDVYNRVVQSHKFSNTDESIALNLSNLSSGIYYVGCDMGKGEFAKFRIVKQVR